MADHLDPRTLADFVQAVHGLLPKVRQGLETFLHDVSQHESLEEAYEALQALGEAALMLGLRELEHITAALERALEDLAAQPSPQNTSQSAWMRQTLAQLDLYLECLLAGRRGEEQALAASILEAFRSLPSRPALSDGVAAAVLPPSPLPPDVLEAPGVAPVPAADVSEELLQGFLTEAEDYLNTMGRILPALDTHPAPQEALQTLRRHVHTFKGASGIVGLRDLARLAHRMEDLLDALYDGRLVLTTSAHELLVATFDVLDDFVRDKRAQGALAPATAMLYQGYARLLGEPPEEVRPEAAAPTVAFGPLEVSRPAVAQAADLIRVPRVRLDELVRLVSECVLSRAVYEQHLGRLSRQVDELHVSLERLRRVAGAVEAQAQADGAVALPEAAEGTPGVSHTPPLSGGHQGFDELEFERYNALQLVSRALTETSADIAASEQELRDIVRDLDGHLTRQSRVTSEMQDKLRQIRMVPLATLATRLQRAVRVTARQQGKEAHLQIEGEGVEFDKTVLEEMAEPLLHLLRNAVDHGIEAPALRQALGKPSCGQICLHAWHAGTQMVLQVRDDGAGLAPHVLRTAAVRGGFVTEAEAGQLSAEQLHRLVFAPGFSTTSEVNEISGRGVGMDIVQATVDRLQGSVELASTPGQGLTCTMRLPLTLAITRVLLVQTHGETLAIPLADVTRVLRLDPEALDSLGPTPVLQLDGQVMPLVSLGEKLHFPQPVATWAPRLPVVCVRAGEQRVALLVDHLLGAREVVVKTLGSHLRRVPGLIGATVLGDGTLVLILNVNELLQEAQRPMDIRSPARPAVAARASTGLEVLIVDDSFSVRRVAANLIRQAGWQPLLAKDGREALEIMQRAGRPPDIILLDVEMPQMDGYELTATLRAQAAYRDVPIIMLTSRAGDKHRQKALEVGATAYLVKPYHDEALLTMIRRLVPHAGGITAA
ncbi:MAG: response regulator [Candidatus Tectimicrobiota bacterium]